MYEDLLEGTLFNKTVNGAGAAPVTNVAPVRGTDLLLNGSQFVNSGFNFAWALQPYINPSVANAVSGGEASGGVADSPN